jgi:predicted RNase H-like nuclease (RuvC/YqgF family)
VRPTHESERIPIAQIEKDAYEWHSWPHSPQDELEIACRRLREAEDRIQQRTAVAKELTKELEERTAWALRLDKELEERTAWALRLDKELAEQTAWAQELNRELERLAWARILYRFARKVYRRVHQLLGRSSGPVIG